MNNFAFTDGASRGNPGPGGWGAVVVMDDQVIELGGRENHTTNNRMELTAVAEVLEYVGDKDITIFTDSGYVVKGATKWIDNWKTNGWKTKQKTDVLNADLWERLDNYFGTVNWKQVPGHLGLPGNERADVIATNFADDKEIELYTGPKDGYGIDIDTHEFDEKALKERSAKRERQAQKAYSYVIMVDGDIQTFKTWSEAEVRVKGKKARYKKSLSPDDEAEIISEFKAM